MNVKNISHDGAVVFWSAGESRHADLLRGLEAIGLEKYAPNGKTDEAALKATLDDYCSSKRTMLRRIGRDKIVQKHKSGADGFDVVDVELSGKDTSNAYTVDFSARVENGRVIVYGGYANTYELQEAWDAHKCLLTGSQVSTSLVSLAVKYLGGVRIKDEGGVYWLPGHAVSAWDNIAAVFESAGRNSVYRMTVEMNQESIRAVKDAVVKEVSQAAGAIVEEIRNNDYGQEALDRRLSAAMALRNRVKEYELILGETLEHLHSVLDVAEAAAGVVQSVKEDDEVFSNMF